MMQTVYGSSGGPMSTNAEPLSDLAIQLELSDIHRQIKRLRQQIDQERCEPANGPLSAYLQFALKSVESAAATLNQKTESAFEAGKNFGPHLVPDSKRWSLFGNTRSSH